MTGGGGRARGSLAGRRIGVVTTSYPREEGDPAGGFVAGFARWLVEAGAAVEVIAAGPGAARVDGIAVARIDGRGLFYGGGAPDALAVAGRRAKAGAWARAGAFQARLGLAVAARIGQWDGAVSHWAVPSAAAVEGARMRRGPVDFRHLAIAHSSDVWMLRRSKWGRALLRAIARRADLVYAGAHLVVDGAPGRVVSMGIDAAACRGDRARGRARLVQCSIDGTRPVALFLGRLVPVKGLDLLFAALPEGMDLVVAGDGPMRATWARSAARRICFVGEVRGEAKRDLLAAADVLVVPSRRLADGREEGTPTVILEALAAGLPVVATRTGGIADVLDDEATGLLVEPTVPALAAALARLADPTHGPSLLRRLAAAGDPERHDWRRVGPILAISLVGG